MDPGSTEMDEKAQTIVQLFAQLERQHYEREDMLRVHRAYALAVSLCTCHYRSSGRAVIDHSLGVASILAALGTDPALVTAGVIHDAYLHGDFGTWRKKIGSDKRARVRDAAGSAAEEIVHQYSWTDRNPQTIPAMRDRIGMLNGMQRDLLLLRLADLLDIYGEADAQYCANVAKRREVARTSGPGIAIVAGELGFPALAAALNRGFAEVRDRTLPAVLATPAWKDGVILPSSYRMRVPIALYQGARFKIYTWLGR
jgi:(p)ppGpp synthase/HD superfamily hydrolase